MIWPSRHFDANPPPDGGVPGKARTGTARASHKATAVL